MKMYKSESDISSQIQPKSRSSTSMKGIKQCNFEAILKYLQKEGSLINSYCNGTSNLINFHTNAIPTEAIKESLIHLEKGFRAFKFSSSNKGIYRIHFARIFDDNILNLFSNKIIQHLKFISKLDLSFEACDYLSNKSLMILGLQIRKHLKHLKYLKIHFKYNQQITTFCVKEFGSLLSKRLTKLEVFNLSFNSFGLLHSECSSSINLGLEKNLRNLKSSDFQFLENFNVRRLYGDHFLTESKPRYTKNLTDFQVWTPNTFSEEIAGTILKYLFKNPETVLNFQACGPEKGRYLQIIRKYRKDWKKEEGPPVLNCFAKAGEWGPEHFMRALGVNSEYETVRVHRIVIQNTIQSERPLSKAEQNQITIHLDYTRNNLFGNSERAAQRIFLNFKEFASLTKGFFQAFQVMIASQSRNLKELVINLKGFREIGGGEDFGNFGRNCIPNLHNLEKLSLSWENCGVTGSKYEMVMTNLTSKLMKLESLDLSFKELLVLFGDKDLASFTKSIQNLAKLKSLKLNLAKLKLSDKGIESLLKNIGNNTSLEELCLVGDKCRVSDKCLEILGEFIFKQLCLKKLDVSFQGCGLTEKAIKEFIEKVSQNCKQLNLTGRWLEEEISKINVENQEKTLFELQDGKFTTEQFGKAMDNMLRNNLDLDKFEKLPFFCISSEEIKTYLEQTKELSYTCRGSEIPEQLSAQDFDFLARNLLAHLKSIEKLELGFPESKLVDNAEALRRFVHDIFKVKSDIKELALDFKNSQITEGIMEELLCEVGNHQSRLESLKINLAGCQGITSKFQKTWIERLHSKSISKVNIELNNE